MTQVEIDSDGDDVVEEYGYDDQGLRVSRAVTESGNTTTTEYLLDLRNPTGYSQILEEYEDGVLSKTHTIGHDVISQHDTTNGVLTLLYDGHGSTRALIDDSGEVVQQFAYEAYGTMIEGVGLTSAAQAWTTILYSGEYFNANTELQWLRTRYLRPSTATFLTRDPIRNPDIQNPISLHTYLYAHANPIAYIDPSGMSISLAFQLGEIAIERIVDFTVRFGPTFVARNIITTAIGRAAFGMALSLGIQYYSEIYLAKTVPELEALADSVTPLSLPVSAEIAKLGSAAAALHYDLTFKNTIRPFTYSQLGPLVNWPLATAHVIAIGTQVTNIAKKAEFIINAYSKSPINFDVDLTKLSLNFVSGRLAPADDIRLMRHIVEAYKDQDQANLILKTAQLIESLKKYGVVSLGIGH